MSHSTAVPARADTAGPRFVKGIDLIRSAFAVNLSESANHVVIAVPTIVICIWCHLPIPGAESLVDVDGNCWCVDCADIVAVIPDVD